MMRINTAVVLGLLGSSFSTYRETMALPQEAQLVLQTPSHVPSLRGSLVSEMPLAETNYLSASVGSAVSTAYVDFSHSSHDDNVVEGHVGEVDAHTLAMPSRAPTVAPTGPTRSPTAHPSLFPPMNDDTASAGNEGEAWTYVSEVGGGLLLLTAAAWTAYKCCGGTRTCCDFVRCCCSPCCPKLTSGLEEPLIEPTQNTQNTQNTDVTITLSNGFKVRGSTSEVVNTISQLESAGFFYSSHQRPNMLDTNSASQQESKTI